MDLYDRAAEAALFLSDRGARDVEMAVILGSGLAAFADVLQKPEVVPYQDIPHWPRPTVPGHPGRIYLGGVGPVKTLVMQGRVHYYEGYPMDVVTFPIRVLKLLKVPSLLITCAAGGLDVRFRKSRLILFQDHINMMGVNPLRGSHDERFGPQFPDMTHTYDPTFLRALLGAATMAQVQVRKGTYAALPGPSYETPAEIRMLQNMKVDAVGMSSVPEAMVANQMGMKVGAIAIITNLAAGLTQQELSHEEVQQEGAVVVEELKKYLSVAIPAAAKAIKGIS